VLSAIFYTLTVAISITWSPLYSSRSRDFARLFSLVCNSALELISAHLNIHCERLFKQTMVSIAYAAIVLSAVLSPVVAFQITPRCRNHKLSPGAHGTIRKCLWYSFLVASSCLCWNFAFDRRTQFSLSGLVVTHSACYFCLRSNEIHDTMST
jgi:hypothetical protein